MNENQQAIADALDAAHGRAKSAYRNRDSHTYMKTFAADLTYRQVGGSVIGRDQLAKDVRAQLSMLDSAETSFTREKLEIVGQQATELLRQSATVTTKHFAILRRTWNIERLGRYVWRKTNDGWLIKEVEVLKETMTSTGIRLALR